jgi:hypothetical protein
MVLSYGFNGQNNRSRRAVLVGVAEYQLAKALPEELKSQLPDVADLEQELVEEGESLIKLHHRILLWFYTNMFFKHS